MHSITFIFFQETSEGEGTQIWADTDEERYKQNRDQVKS